MIDQSMMTPFCGAIHTPLNNDDMIIWQAIIVVKGLCCKISMGNEKVGGKQKHSREMLRNWKRVDNLRLKPVPHGSAGGKSMAQQFVKKPKIPLDILGKGWYHTMRMVNTTP